MLISKYSTTMANHNIAKDSPTTFKPGQSGNPAGRPKGKTMKEFAREFLLSMTDEDKRKWLKGLSPEIVWRMSEGNPHNTGDMVVREAPRPLLDGATVDE